MVNEKYRIGDKYKVETVKYRVYKGDAWIEHLPFQSQTKR
jgi:hypothetical protein